jgi:hypothetical protein
VDALDPHSTLTIGIVLSLEHSWGFQLPAEPYLVFSSVALLVQPQHATAGVSLPKTQYAVTLATLDCPRPKWYWNPFPKLPCGVASHLIHEGWATGINIETQEIKGARTFCWSATYTRHCNSRSTRDSALRNISRHQH